MIKSYADLLIEQLNDLPKKLSKRYGISEKQAQRLVQDPELLELFIKVCNAKQ